MKLARVRIAYFLILLFLILGVDAVANEADPPLVDGNTTIVDLYNVSENEPFKKRVLFAPASNIIIEVTNIPTRIAFIIVQVHALHYNVTLSYDKTLLNKVSNRSVFGSNIGLYFDTKLRADVQVFLKNDNVHIVKALLVATAYGKYAAIPGGCNMEFNTETAPYQRVVNHNSMVVVDAQPAALPNFSGKEASCEKHTVRHDMYMMRADNDALYSAGSYFGSIEMMLTVNDTVRNGRKIPPPLTASPMRRVYSAYPGISTVYAVVATYGNYSVSYVPAFSYACSPLLNPESCHFLNDSFSQWLCAIALLIGVLWMCSGLCFKYVDKNLPNFLTGGIVGYTIAIGIGHHSLTINLIIGIVTGALVTLISALLWKACCRNTSLRTLMITLPLGYFLASLAYFNMPAEMTVMESDWLFWASFVSVMLMVCVLGQLCQYIAKIVCYSVVSPLILILPIDYYSGLPLKYIIINVMRRQTVSGFNQAVIAAPMMHLEVLVIILWVIMGLHSVKRFICGGVSLISCIKGMMPERSEHPGMVHTSPPRVVLHDYEQLE